MELFQSFEENMTFIIVRVNSIPEMSTPTSHLTIFSKLKLFLPHFSLIVFGIVLAILYINYDAKTFRDYSGGVYSLLAVSINYAYILIVSSERIEIFQFIDNIRIIIDKRTGNGSKIIYKEAIAFVNKLTQIAYFGLLRIVLPLITLPYAMFSYYLYFMTDSGRNAFSLPFRAW